MKVRLLSSLLVLSTVLMSVRGVPAFETDQFNLSPEPLSDIGDEVSQHVADKLVEAVDDLNSNIQRSARCLEAPSKSCGSQAEEQKRLLYLRSNDAVADAVFKRLGDGNIFRTKFGKWINSHDFRSGLSRYKTGYFESIYVAAPANYLTISPTINMFGTEFGTDKLEHFFQQGYHYYQLKREQLTKGADDAHAVLKAVQWGQKTERTYYGLLVSGVYSNADLYANYAGMRFFEGLTAAIDVGGDRRPAIVNLANGRWQINEPASLRDRLLKPFISEHLNEEKLATTGTSGTRT
jgi:hypothetical protein